MTKKLHHVRSMVCSAVGLSDMCTPMSAATESIQIQKETLMFPAGRGAHTDLCTITWKLWILFFSMFLICLFYFNIDFARSAKSSALQMCFSLICLSDIHMILKSGLGCLLHAFMILDSPSILLKLLIKLLQCRRESLEGKCKLVLSYQTCRHKAVIGILVLCGGSTGHNKTFLLLQQI